MTLPFPPVVAGWADSRRLTGGNGLFAAPGVVLEAVFQGEGGATSRVMAACIAEWAQTVAAIAEALGWLSCAPCASPPVALGPLLPLQHQSHPLIVSRTHASGVSLAFVAPADQLLIATEVNEWAWERACATVAQTPFANATSAMETFAGAPIQPTDAPLSLTLDTAITAWRSAIARNAQPQLVALLQYAATHQVAALWDDVSLTLGTGATAQTWPLALAGEVGSPSNAPRAPMAFLLPTLAALQPDWPRYHTVPTALVTGSNGKTTSVRLIVAMAAAAGQCTGHNCTDGVFVAGQALAEGDYSGPMGARLVLRDPRTTFAVLETARGGLLRRGLAVSSAHAVLITNISADHFGEYGIDSLADLARAKLITAQALLPGGTLVVNADDPLLLATARAVVAQLSAAPALALFAQDADHPELVALRQVAGASCGVRAGRLWLTTGTARHDLGDFVDMPLTMGGLARYNIANLAGAALTAHALGVPIASIVQVLRQFGQRRQDNPGRLEHWQRGGVTVLVDYAHNPDGLAGLLQVASGRLQQSGGAANSGRLGLLLGQAGNRDDTAIAALARTAAEFKPHKIILKDIAGFMRGRTAAAVPTVLQAALIAAGLPEQTITIELEEVLAAQQLVDWAQSGDVVVLPLHGSAARAVLLPWLDQWAAGVNIEQL